MKFLRATSAVLGAAVSVAAMPAARNADLVKLLTPAEPLVKARAALTRVDDFGANASGTKMYIYVPDELAAKPPVVVAVHYCTGTALAYYRNSPYAQLADQKGFIVVYPESPYDGGCWDVSSREALRHDGGADSNSIANMVDYTVEKYGADASRVYVTGTSSGAMMTNVLAATYPDKFAAGIVYSGVGAGCFSSSAGDVDAWNNTCSSGQAIATPEAWAQVVFDMYPGYEGARPKMQIYHGSIDVGLDPRNFNETLKQWCGVFGYDYSAPQSTEVDTPLSRYTTYTWGDGYLVGVYAEGVGHTVPIRGADDMEFFGL